MMTWLEAVPSSRSRPKRSKNPSLGKRTWQWTNTLRQKCGSMLGTWVCWIEISKSLIFTVTEFEITFTSNDNFQTWTNAIYKGLPELSPKNDIPQDYLVNPPSFATEVRHAMLECTSVAQRCSLTMWKSGTAHPSWSHLEKNILNGGSLVRSCFGSFGPVKLKQTTEKASKSNRLIDIHAWVSQKLNSSCNHEYGQSMAIQFSFLRWKGDSFSHQRQEKLPSVWKLVPPTSPRIPNHSQNIW